jgi:hypothetical protein
MLPTSSRTEGLPVIPGHAVEFVEEHVRRRGKRDAPARGVDIADQHTRRGIGLQRRHDRLPRFTRVGARGRYAGCTKRLRDGVDNRLVIGEDDHFLISLETA